MSDSHKRRSVWVKWSSPWAVHQAQAEMSRLEVIDLAIEQLRSVRVLLRNAFADKAADAVARAMKSAEGAHRHAERFGWNHYRERPVGDRNRSGYNGD